MISRLGRAAASASRACTCSFAPSATSASTARRWTRHGRLLHTTARVRDPFMREWLTRGYEHKLLKGNHALWIGGPDDTGPRCLEGAHNVVQDYEPITIAGTLEWRAAKPERLFKRAPEEGDGLDESKLDLRPASVRWADMPASREGEKEWNALLAFDDFIEAETRASDDEKVWNLVVSTHGGIDSDGVELIEMHQILYPLCMERQAKDPVYAISGANCDVASFQDGAFVHITGRLYPNPLDPWDLWILATLIHCPPIPGGESFADRAQQLAELGEEIDEEWEEEEDERLKNTPMEDEVGEGGDDGDFARGR